MADVLEDRLKEQARNVGFSLVGIAAATDAETFPQYAAWLDAGYAGEMGYLHRRRDARRNPASILQSVRSVVMLGYEYPGLLSAEPRPSPYSGRVAAYARGPDYHRLLWDRLNRLAEWLMSEVPGATAFGVADTAPLLERDYARRAGLGWFGKNTMLINKYRGSCFFLAGLLTSVELSPDPPHQAAHCGLCTACLEACPTQAFPQPGVLDARRCISYLTIELRQTIPEELAPQVGEWLWGCDICQQVCPWNRRAGQGEGLFPNDPSRAFLDPVELLGLDDQQFRDRFRGTVFFRGKRTNLLRNAAIVLGNLGDASVLPRLQESCHDPDPVIAAAARWAVQQIRQRLQLGGPGAEPLNPQDSATSPPDSDTADSSRLALNG